MKRLTQILSALLGVAALIITALVATGRITWRAVRNWFMNRSKCFWRSVVAVVMLLILAFAAMVAYAFYLSKYGRDYWDKKISQNVVLHSYADCTYRVYNRQANEYMTEKIMWLSDVADNDSIAVYALPGKRGYLNVNSGRIIIDADTAGYSKAWIFSEGLAAVMKKGKIGFINTKNEVVIPFEYNYSYSASYVFHNGLCTMNDSNGHVGLIDKAGNWALPPVYDEIWTPRNDGYRKVVKDGKYGLLNSAGTLIYPAEYCNINIVADGFILTKEGRKWQVDFAGNTVQPVLFDGTYYLNYPNGYNECGEIAYTFANYLKYEVMNRYGIMNRITGEIITPAIYSDINMLSSELFEVQDSDNYAWHLLDTNGNVVRE